MSIKKWIGGLLVLCWFVQTGWANYTMQLSYVQLYRNIAVQEMLRTGIPASITMAQALHESRWGTSELASIGNNHFGIKCKSEWTGSTIYRKDDDKDANGVLIESCFRSYQDAQASFIDHSNFLMQNNRYSGLFGFAKTDYVQWAAGLQRCGYATDEKYAQKLIELIEKHKLYLLDISQVNLPDFTTNAQPTAASHLSATPAQASPPSWSTSQADMVKVQTFQLAEPAVNVTPDTPAIVTNRPEPELTSPIVLTTDTYAAAPMTSTHTASPSQKPVFTTNSELTQSVRQPLVGRTIRH